MPLKIDSKKIPAQVIYTSRFNPTREKYVVNKVLCPHCFKKILDPNFEYSVQDKIKSFHNNALNRFLYGSISSRLKEKGITSCPDCKQQFELD